VRLPKGFRFDGNEVGVKKSGGILILYPLDSPMDEFLNAPSVSDDFVESILEARREDFQQERESL